MSRSKRFQKIKDIKTREKDAAASALGTAQAHLTSQKDQKERIKEFQKEYSERFCENAQQGLSAAEYRQYRAFISQLQQMEVTQEGQIAQAERSVEDAKSHWFDKHKDEHIYGKLVEQSKVEEDKVRAKKEQAELDDLPKKRSDIL